MSTSIFLIIYGEHLIIVVRANITINVETIWLFENERQSYRSENATSNRDARHIMYVRVL